MTKKSTLIKDTATRNAVSNIEDKLKNIESIKQIPNTATLNEVIAIINQITNSLKRK